MCVGHIAEGLGGRVEDRRLQRVLRIKSPLNAKEVNFINKCIITEEEPYPPEVNFVPLM